MMRALVLAWLALTAVQQQPQRDTSAVTPTVIGTGSVSGLVTLGDEADTIVRRAVVTMISSDGLDTRSTISDDAGRFAIAGLPAGRYTLQALKAAHLTMALGARRPGRPGTALVLAEGQHVTDVRLALPRGGVLAGRLTFDDGRPVPNVQVMAIPLAEATAGGTTPSGVLEFRTDDRGEFRIYGLMPDSYVVAAIPLFGRGEIERRSDAEYDALVRTLGQPRTAAAGQPTTGRPEAPPPAPTVGYAPTYFPGTPVVTDATPVPVRAGEVKDGLSFTVSTVPVATIRGTVLGVTGQPAQASAMTVEPIGPPLPLAATLAPRVNRPNGQGEFSITGLGPGRYRVRARAGGVTLQADGTLRSIVGAAQTDWAVAEVTVSGADVDGLTLTLQPGRVFRGRLVADSAPPASWKGAVVAVQPLGQGSAQVINGLSGGIAARQIAAGEDGRFEVTGLEPHEYEIRVTLPAALAGAGWTLGTIRQGERDLRDAPLTFAEGSIEGVDIVLTKAVTELTGRLTSESGTPATDYFIVAFPADRALWHPASPRVRIMRPAADGAFATRDLPAGTYRLAALTDIEDGEQRRAEFLESIYEAAIAVTVTTGSTTRQELRIR